MDRTYGSTKRSSAGCREFLRFLTIFIAAGIIVTVALVVTNFIHIKRLQTSWTNLAGVADSTECNSPTSDTCNPGFLIDDTSCQYRPAKASTPCESECFAANAESAHCDPATGTCVLDDPSECDGWCELDAGELYETSVPCYHLFEVHPYLLNPDDYANGYALDTVLDTGGTGCLANSCVKAMVTVQVATYANTNPSGDYTNNAPLSCLDYLNTSAVNKSCMEVVEVKLNTPKFTEQLYEYDDWGPAPINGNFTGRMCFVYYSCAPFNATTFANMELSGKKKREATSSSVRVLLPVHQQPGLAVFPSEARHHVLDFMEGQAHQAIVNGAAAARKRRRNVDL